MTDHGLPNGLPIVDAAPACPFVAFDEDRDERATSPDHRHRCYAELRPAPRALAHQSAYCLSSAFPACPTFQDWARREAARPRPAPAIGGGILGEARRNPPRDWSDPPPWKTGAARPEAAGEGTARRPPDTTPSALWAGAPGAAAGSAAAGAGAAASVAGSSVSAPGAGRAGSWADGPRIDAADADSGASTFRAGRSHPDQGLADSTALRIASGRTDDAAWREDATGAETAAAAMAGSEARPYTAGSRAMRPEPEVVGPAWERPRRFEAYPALKTRVGLPNVPRVAIMAAAIIVAAIVLFFVPALLGIGKQNAGLTSSGSPAASLAPSASLTVTAVPASTPLTYIVAPNDTMSKIAARFHIPLADLVAANASKYPNPDKIKIGDVLVIPTPQPSTLQGASASP